MKPFYDDADGFSRQFGNAVLAEDHKNSPIDLDSGWKPISGRQLAGHPLEARRLQPVLEGGAIAQGTWPAGQAPAPVPGIV
jgi:hypothetical protein